MDESQRNQLYQSARQKIAAILTGETDDIVRMATVSAVLADTFPYYYWVGFYRLINNELVLGPYQGTPACLRIQLGRGVCGTAATDRKTQLVEDVDSFPGHIACDAKSKSELVVPVLDSAGDLIAVFDVDSDQLAAFNETDAHWLEVIVHDVFAASA